MRKILLIFFLLVNISSANAAYSYYRTITIDHTKCGSVDVSNYPLFVDYTDNTLKTTGGGGHVTNASGYDIAFYSDSGLTTPLFWEIESYNGSTGQFRAYVKTSCTVASDKVIYMAYGNAAINTFQSTSTSVWDSNYQVVFHYPDGTTLNRNDSTINAVTGSNDGSMLAAAGKVGSGSAFFDGGSSIIYGDTVNITGTAITIEGWWNRPDNSHFSLIGARNGTAGAATPLQYQFSHTSNAFGNLLHLDFTNSGGTLKSFDSTTAHNVTNAWHYFVVTYDGANVKFYYDGTAEGSTAETGSIIGTLTGTQFRVGSDKPRGTSYSTGNGDEIRLSNTARSPSYVTATYNNYGTPATFTTLGSETSPSSGGSARKAQRCVLSKIAQCN